METPNKPPKTELELRSCLESLHAGDLVTMLTDIGLRLSFDEEGRWSPSESVAADSAADFVESVAYVFDSRGITI